MHKTGSTEEVTISPFTISREGTNLPFVRVYISRGFSVGNTIQYSFMPYPS